jgi:DNA anti-recombination protein RmuC
MATIEKKSSTITSEVEQLKGVIAKLKADLDEAKNRYEEAQKIFCDESLRRAGDMQKSADKLQKHHEKALEALRDEHKEELKRVHASYACQANASGVVAARFN